MPDFKYDSQKAAYEVFRQKFDAGESMWLSEQLTAFEQQIYQTEYEGYLYSELAPVVSDGEGLQAVGYWEEDKAGKAEFISSGGEDIPKLNRKRKKITMPVFHFAAEYGWTYFELAESRRMRIPLENDSAIQARDAMELFLDDIFFDGDKPHAVPGLFTNAAKYGELTIAAGGLKSKTPDELIVIFSDLILAVYENSKRRHMANVVLMPVSVESHLKTARVTDVGVSILTYLQVNHPGVRFVGTDKFKNRTEKLASGTKTNKNFLAAYKLDPMVMKYKVPVPFLQHPLERSRLEFYRDTTGDIAGLEIKNYTAFSVGAADLD